MRERGQVLLFDPIKRFGVIMSESGKRHFFSGYDLAEPVAQNDWVSFSSKPNIMAGRREIDLVAYDVQRINFSAEDLIHGTVVSWFPDRLFGFIDYKQDGCRQSAFFHVRDLLEADGVELVPVVGCRVSFYKIQKAGSSRPTAAQIWIEEWPEEPTFEEQFAAAEELPIEIPEPVVAAPQSVLSPATKHLSLIEIMNRQRRKQEKS